MTDLVAVLVAPASDRPPDGEAPGLGEALLAPGRCGAMPPIMVRVDLTRSVIAPDSTLGFLFEATGESEWQVWEYGDVWQEGYPRALPLWWDGALVPEGWDRARRVLWESPASIHPAHRGAVHAFTPESGDPSGAEWLACELVRWGLASRVFRLARRRGRLVEVTT